jgi:dTDP-4-amino-4,6-dideoxygalactose transaminase
MSVNKISMRRLGINDGIPIRRSFLSPSQPLITQKSIAEVVDTLKSGWLTTGPKVFKFEKKFQSYIGCKYAIAVNSGTSALHLSLVLAGVKPGDEVITSPFTWISTVNPILYCSAKPIFVDIERQTLNINPKKIKEAITDKTKAIIPVHVAGRPCDMREIKRIASKNKIAVIEDCAHAVGATYKGRKIGTISTLNCFSFQAIKHIACGEGGMITTNNAIYANRAKSLRLYGVDRRTWQNYHLRGFKLPQAVSLGYKYNWNDIHASIGLHQLDRIDRQLKTREQLAEAYYKGLKGLPIELPPKTERDSRRVCQGFCGSSC